jgi:ribosomal protein L11 methylase PrmA
MSDIPTEKPDPWQTPTSDLDPDLVETSRRLVAKSDSAYSPSEASSEGEVQSPPDPKLLELEHQNKYLFDRNTDLVGRIAQLEAVNHQLQEKIALLQKTQQPQRPWFLRWLSGA